MLELGNETEGEHEALGAWLAQQKIDRVVLCGTHMKHAAGLSTKFEYYSTPDDLLKAFDWNAVENSHVLIKGSRGMKLERLLS